MTIKIGDDILNGQVFVLALDPNGLITQVSIPALGDGTGPAVINFNPGKAPADIAAALTPILALIGL